MRARGGLDSLVSNAGAAWQGRLAEVDDETLRRSFELNFFAHQTVAQNAVRVMLAQGTGGALLFNASKQAAWYSTAMARWSSSGGSDSGSSGSNRGICAFGPGLARWSSGASADMTSSAEVVTMAPFFSRLLAPSERGSSGDPGTAKTSRPSSLARRADISEPERIAASTTMRPSDSAAMMRLRRGKSRARGSQPKGISVIDAPTPLSIAFNSSAFSGG